jgi:L-fuconolactonase
VRGVVGWADLKAAGAPARLRQLAGHPLFKGVRPMLQDLDDDAWIADAALAPAVAALIALGLSFDALVLPRHLPSLLVFARRFPALPICIDHAAKPDIAGGLRSPWADDLARLAELPNVVCKLSGMVTEAGTDWQVGQLAPYAGHVLACFGAGRVLWGSDWPVLNLASDYAGWVGASAQLLARLDDGERAQVMGLNAQRFYRLD